MSVKKDCKMYDKRRNRCTGLRALYCDKYRECNFYKPKKESEKEQNNEDKT